MTLYDYRASQQLSGEDYPFYALIMTAMRQADTDNEMKLRAAWPEVWEELCSRYHAPRGMLAGESESG